MYRVIAAAAVLLSALPAMAQPAGPPHHRGGGPEGQEGPGGGQHLFISPAGEPFRGEGGKSKWFAGADTNHDGVLTLNEFRDDAMRFFKVLDVNGDGQIDGPENSLYETKVAPEITRLEFMGGGPSGGFQRPMIKRSNPKAEPRTGAARYSMLNEPQPVRGADADLNQRVSAEEWAKAAKRRFEILDTDKDDKLTLETLPGRP